MAGSDELHNLLHEFAHDIKGSLAVIKEGILLVSDKTLGEINSEQGSSLSTALKGVIRIQEIIQEYYKKYGT